MNIPNPISTISNWRDGRAVDKIRRQYQYSLEAYKKRHSATAEKDDKFFIFGIFSYFALTMLAAYLDLIWLYLASFPMLLIALLLPMVMSYYEQWVLKSKLTLTLKVVPNDPEESRPVTMRLEGVEFGAPMTTPDELLEFIHSEKGHLIPKKKHLWSVPGRRSKAKTQEKPSEEESEKEEAEKTINETLDRNMKLYAMKAKGDPVPTLIQFPGDPEAELRPREEKVRLGYGVGKLRHATITVLECDPVQTSIRAKNKIIDVEYALFSPIVFQRAIDDWLQDASWHVPTRVTQEVATYVKQNVDTAKNASYFTVLEKQRDDAIRGREKLQLQNKTEQMNADLDGEMMQGYRKTPGTYTFNDIILWLVITGAIGAILMWAVS